jgi:hypothetical protein
MVDTACDWIPMGILKRFWPLLLTFSISAAYVFFRLALVEWDPIQIAEIAIYSQDGTEVIDQGYDGQFFYHMAITPSSEELVGKLDVPAYRYQRILYPLLAHLLVFGNADFIPWVLIVINLLAHLIGTGALIELLREYGVWIGYSLIYGLWVGVVAPIGLDLSEPLAYALVIVGLLFRKRGNFILGAILLTLALFTKETTALFWIAALIADMLSRTRTLSVVSLLVGGFLYGIWQFGLYLSFGSFGIGSGGAMATPFEVIPFMGLWRIGMESLPVLGLFLVIFGPTIVLPTIWALVASIRALFNRQIGINSWSLLFNAMVVVVLPFSTFREPLGLVRIATGVVLATTCFAAEYSILRALNYGMFWIALLFILVNS